MEVTLTPPESSYLANLVVERNENDAFRSVEGEILRGVMIKLVLGNPDFTPQEVGYFQAMLQEQLEINGSRRFGALEKKPSVPSFVAQKTLTLIKTISDKLGAHLLVDTQTPEIEQGAIADPVLKTGY